VWSAATEWSCPRRRGWLGSLWICHRWRVAGVSCRGAFVQGQGTAIVARLHVMRQGCAPVDTASPGFGSNSS
jgi:hypothetical protein